MPLLVSVRSPAQNAGSVAATRPIQLPAPLAAIRASAAVPVQLRACAFALPAPAVLHQARVFCASAAMHLHRVSGGPAAIRAAGLQRS